MKRRNWYIDTPSFKDNAHAEIYEGSTSIALIRYTDNEALDEARTHLIANAPELLEALKELNRAIQDWIGNVCFNGREFKSFDEAWAFIYKKFEHLEETKQEEEFQEYSVLEVPNE